MIEHSAIPMSSPNFCIEASESTCKDGLVAVLNMNEKKGVLKIVDADGDVKGTSCSLTENGKDILESIKDVLSTQFEITYTTKNKKWEQLRKR